MIISLNPLSTQFIISETAAEDDSRKDRKTLYSLFVVPALLTIAAFVKCLMVRRRSKQNTNHNQGELTKGPVDVVVKYSLTGTSHEIKRNQSKCQACQVIN